VIETRPNRKATFTIVGAGNDGSSSEACAETEVAAMLSFVGLLDNANICYVDPEGVTHTLTSQDLQPDSIVYESEYDAFLRRTARELSRSTQVEVSVQKTNNWE
jgi:hypothetical protein